MKIIAHRCGTEIYPQLTIAGAKDSLLAGAAYVEIDIRFTSDGIPVVNHDDNAMTLFGRPEKIEDMTLTEFLTLRHKTAPAFPSHSFEHFLQSDVENILFHIKRGGEQLIKVLALCRKYGVEKKVVFGVQSVEDAKTVKQFNPEIEVLAFMPGGDFEEITANIRKFAEAGADELRLWENWDWRKLGELVKSCGKRVWIMSNNREVCPNDCGYTTREALREMEAQGVDGVLVNTPHQFA